MEELSEKNPEACKHFISCSANMCPLDPEIELRTWFIGEEICKRKDFALLPGIRRQKQLNKRKPEKFKDKALAFGWLVESAPRKRNLSDEHRSQLILRLKKHKA